MPIFAYSRILVQVPMGYPLTSAQICKPFLFSFLLLFFLLPLAHGQAPAQQCYYVFLQEKGEAPVDWASRFHPNALARRERLGVGFPSWEDLPLRDADCEAISAIVDTMRYRLRWLNAVSVGATEEQIARVRALACVKDVQAMDRWETVLAEVEEFAVPPADTGRKRELYRSVERQLNLDTLRASGLDGRGVRIAVFDAGFTGVDEHVGFAHLWKNGQIGAMRDFYSGKKDVFHGSGHGTAVLGCIGGMGPWGPIGAAQGAHYMLARTEHSVKEKAIEEDHWLAAAEWADSLGADIISSSLGYAKKRYAPAQMDGRTTLVTRAAATAVRKGILVVNSAGNEGNNSFKTLGAPADADSVLTVGGSYPMLKYVMPFSSVGPNARGVLKPEVAAPGYVLSTAKNGDYKEFPGTSFACPLVAGMAACLWQGHPEWNNMEVKEKLMEAGHLYPYFDYVLGYGVVDARRFFREKDSVGATLEIVVERDTLWILPDLGVFERDKVGSKNGRPLHVAAVRPDGRLGAYYTVRLKGDEKRLAVQPAMRKAGRIRVWWEGYIWEEGSE